MKRKHVTVKLETALGNYDTAFVPQGLGHHFEKNTQQPMAMIWVYAGPEPKRKLIDAF